jgi:hypothetical protein
MAAIIFIFGTPAIIAAMAFGVWHANNARRERERERARQTYEQLIRDKLDVIRTAMTMGYGDDDIRDLDARLERLIGQDKMQSLLDPKHPRAPEINSEVMDTDLVAEVERIKEKQRRKAKQ